MKKLTPMNWFMIGAVGVGAWWLYKKSQNGNGNGAAMLPVAPVEVPLPGTAPADMMPGEMVDEAIAENTTATSGLGYTGGIYSRHLFAGMK